MKVFASVVRTVSTASSRQISLKGSRGSLYVSFNVGRPARYSCYSTRSQIVKGVAMEMSSKMAETITIPPPYHPTQDIQKIIRLALDEDAGDLGDITSLACMSEDAQATATFLAKADGTLAGVAVASMVFEMLDPSIQVEWTKLDGESITKGTKFGTVKGPAIAILTAERVALNFMQRMSGIATATRAMADAAKPARMLETRKTVPGLRILDKWAVLIGGGENHRMGLYDMLMIKDNHVAASGGITPAVKRARDYLGGRGLALDIELETRTLEEVAEAVKLVDEGEPATGRICRIMLDNMSIETMQQAVGIVNGKCDTEASGNVTLDTVNAIGATGVTYISSGALTHSVQALDISFNIET